METTIIHIFRYMGFIGDIVGLHRDNGKENGNYRDYRDYRDYIGIIGFILGLYRDNGKENGNYYSMLGLYWD